MFIGKDWARGLTATTDARIARNAERHRGLTYQRRSPLAGPNDPRPNDRRIRWKRIAIPGVDRPWTAEFAYAIGLLATDGCLGGGKTVTFTSKDIDLIESFKRCVGADAPIGRNGDAYRVQITDVRFFQWLSSIGVTPRKSLTLAALDVPRELIAHTVRGLLDGDGTIVTSMTTPNRKRYPGHAYQRLRVQFLSGGERHIEWLRGILRQELGVEGWVTTRRKRSADDRYAPLHVLRYSKHESIVLLSWLYSAEDAPRLERKRVKWIEFRDHGKPTRRWHRDTGPGAMRELA